MNEINKTSIEILSWAVSKENVEISITSDENGFYVRGDHKVIGDCAAAWGSDLNHAVRNFRNAWSESEFNEDDD